MGIASEFLISFLHTHVKNVNSEFPDVVFLLNNSVVLPLFQAILLVTLNMQLLKRKSRRKMSLRHACVI